MEEVQHIMNWTTERQPKTIGKLARVQGHLYGVPFRIYSAFIEGQHLKLNNAKHLEVRL